MSALLKLIGMASPKSFLVLLLVVAPLTISTEFVAVSTPCAITPELEDDFLFSFPAGASEGRDVTLFPQLPFQMTCVRDEKTRLFYLCFRCRSINRVCRVAVESECLVLSSLASWRNPLALLALNVLWQGTATSHVQVVLALTVLVYR